MLENLKTKFKVFLEKIETAPWYVRIFIGSWVSLYTSVFAWFVLTSWNPAIYEGQFLKLMFIYFAAFIGYFWLSFVIVVNYIMNKVGIFKILLCFSSCYILIFYFLIYNPYPLNFGVYSINTINNGMPNIKITKYTVLNNKNRVSSSFTGVMPSSLRRFIYINNLWGINEYIPVWTFIGFFIGSISQSESIEYFNDNIFTPELLEEYSLERINYIENIKVLHRKLGVNKCEVILFKNKYKKEYYIVDESLFDDKNSNLKNICNSLIDNYSSLYSLINFRYSNNLVKYYKNTLPEEDYKKHKSSIKEAIDYMENNMPESLKQISNLKNLKKFINKNKVEF